jgi:ribosomal protein S18 acetylase RimI-like enzyme
MSKPLEIVHVDRSRAPSAVKTLVRAFVNRPPLSHYYPVVAEQRRLAPALMSLAVYPGIRYGEVHVTAPDFWGVAVWMPSEAYPLSLWRLLRSTPLHSLVEFGRYGGYRLRRLGRFIDSVHDRLAPFRHVYLQSLGVDPAFQGKGHAAKLLRYMLARLDATRTPCYLDTLDEQNVGLYQHFGFSVVEASPVPDTGFPLWAMLREAGGREHDSTSTLGSHAPGGAKFENRPLP